MESDWETYVLWLIKYKSGLWKTIETIRLQKDKLACINRNNYNKVIIKQFKYPHEKLQVFFIFIFTRLLVFRSFVVVFL